MIKDIPGEPKPLPVFKGHQQKLYKTSTIYAGY